MLMLLLGLIGIAMAYIYLFGAPAAIAAQPGVGGVLNKTTNTSTTAKPTPLKGHKGRLIVHAHGATNLRNVQSIGKQDPYIRLTIGKETREGKEHEDGGKQAVWNQQFLFDLDGAQDDVLHIRVMDKNVTIDESIGRADIPFNDLLKARSKTSFTLFDPDNFSKQAGQVELHVEYTPAYN